ncbi:MAG: 1-deoxy-D-xylulose-5-phosphate reductoisomerase [Phycisphaeraceae bacterium]
MSQAANQDPRRLIVLGSTGSIGVNTLKVVEHLNASGALRIQVAGLAAGRQLEPLIQQARQFAVPAVAVADPACEPQLRHALPDTRIYSGADAALRLVEDSDATDLTAAIVGSAGLPATLAGIRKSMRIGLANKETLVAAGALVTPLCRAHGAQLIPVDSEHSAIFQCLQGLSNVRGPDRETGRQEDKATLDSSAIKRIVLTASGGPFRTASMETMRNATVEQALNHPTWKMGAKISIDSATMMNKALEIIEAHWLFDLPAEKIAVIIHPQSVAHSFVEFADHSVLAQLGPPDMKTPIQYALMYPHRPAGCSDAMDWSKLAKLEFEQPDMEKFRALQLAYDVIEAGGTAGAVFNAANEAAVAAFLDRRIRFGRIVELVTEALSAIEPVPVDSLATVLAADRQAREFVNQRLATSV